MSATHVVLGKGPIGRTLTDLLAATGENVVVASRSGAPSTAPPAPGVRHVAMDVTDADALATLATGARSITCAVNPPYHRWPTTWPPVVDSLLEAGARSGAVVVMVGNLYAYGADHPRMTEDTPLDSTEGKGLARALVWSRLRAAHERGDIRATEIRGSDYVGPGAGRVAHGGDRILDPLLAGRTVRPIGSADQPHTWTYLPDFARALAAAATTEEAWGRAWHVPSPEPLTIRELVDRFADQAGLPHPKVSPLPTGMLRALGAFSPMLREVGAVSYQFAHPFVMDSTRSQEVLGLAPTPWDRITAETLATRPPARTA